MAIFGLTEVLEYLKDDMAKVRGQKITQPSDEQLVESYVVRLARALDKPSTDHLLKEMQQDDRLAASDLISIAHRYNKGGKRATSRKAAFDAIGKRALEIRHFHAKNKIAEKARPW